MPKKSKKKSKNSKKKGKKFQIKFKKPSWEDIKSSKATKYSLIVLLVLLFFVAVDFGVQYLNNDYSAAVVNGKRITDREYYNRLDQSYGSSVVSQLIEEKLILQEAQKQGVTATEEEIQDDLNDITEQVGGEEQLNISLEAYNLSLEDLKKQIELDILKRKVLEPTIEYSEEDVTAFFEDYSELMFPEEAEALEEGELLDYESHREETLDYFLQQEIETASSTWLAELKEQASIQDNVTDKPAYKFLGATRNIIGNIWDDVNSNEGEAQTEAEG